MLTDTAIRKAKPRDKFYKVSDGAGLYLLVKSTGKYWRMDYRFFGKRKTLAIGVYPAVSLVAARKKRDETRELLANDIDPSLTKAINKQSVRTAAEILLKQLCWNGTQRTPRFGQKQQPQISNAILRRYFSLARVC